MSDLETFRDHCQRMADSRHLDDCERIHRVTKALAGYGSELDWTISCADLTGHEPHEWVGDRGFDWYCPGLCSGCMPDAQRALWTRLADEVDAYLSHDDAPLWEDA